MDFHIKRPGDGLDCAKRDVPAPALHQADESTVHIGLLRQPFLRPAALPAKALHVLRQRSQQMLAAMFVLVLLLVRHMKP